MMLHCPLDSSSPVKDDNDDDDEGFGRSWKTEMMLEEVSCFAQRQLLLSHVTKK